VTEITTGAFPQTVVSGNSGSGVLFVDSVALINFDRIGNLDTLLAADRTVIVTPEVLKEAVSDGLASNNPAVFASAQRIGSWVQLHSSLGDVKVDASDPNRAQFTGTGAGEKSILADAAFLNGSDNAVVVSDDNHIALSNVPGSDVPVLTGNYFLNSLLLGGGITPSEYFQQTSAGLGAGFNQSVLSGDSSSILGNGVEYGITIGGVPRGFYQYTTTGSSSITMDGQTIFFAPYEKGGIQDGMPVKVTDASDGGHTDTYFDTANLQPWFTNSFAYDPQDRLVDKDTVNDNGTSTRTDFNVAGTQPWSSQTSTFDISGVLQSQQEVFAAGNELLKYYDTQNTHPYTELDVSEAANGNITAAQITLDPNVVASGGSIGDIFGSAIGRALAGNNQFVQLGVGTVAGYIGQQLGGQFSQSLLTNGANFSFANAFGNIGIGLAGAGAGSIASFLTAEIGVALGLHGYSAQLFDAALGGTFSSLASQAATIGLSNTMAQISWSAAAGTAEANVGAALGSILAQQILPAENKDGVVGGQLLGAIGSAIGISLTIGEGLGFALDTIIPGIGSLIGTILGTLIGDLFGGSSQHPSATFTVDPGSYLYVAAFQAVSTSDGGDRSIPQAMAGGVVNIVNAYLTAVGGVALGEMTQELIGYQTDNPSVPYIAEELSQNFYLIPHYQHAEDAVNTTALDLLHHTEAVGGDLLLKRAHQDSQYTDVVALSGDLQVAEDYERYLNNREAINALIAANAVATVPHAEHA
jgi:hypothetical protein